MGWYVFVSAAVLVIIPPWILLEMRFLLGAFALAAPMIWQKAWRVYLRHFPLLALVGFIDYTCSIGLQFIGTAISGAAYGSLITSSAPLLILLFAVIILREPLYLFVQPVVGGLLGAVLLHERLTPEYFTGAALIAVGVFLLPVKLLRSRCCRRSRFSGGAWLRCRRSAAGSLTDDGNRPVFVISDTCAKHKHAQNNQNNDGS